MECAGNRGRVTIYSQTSAGRIATRPGTNGYYESVLCSDCNGVGSVYAQQYVNVLLQLERAPRLTLTDGRQALTLHGVYPLRLLKQLVLQFLCAPPFAPAPIWQELQDFVLDRHALLPSSAPSIYLYRNLSRWGRVVPCCGVLEFGTGRTVVVSEVSWPPLGVVFSFHPHPTLEGMQDVTTWGQRSFTDCEDLTVQLPQHHVHAALPLMYGSKRQMENDEAARLPAYLLHVPDGSTYASAIGALIERKAYQS